MLDSVRALFKGPPPSPLPLIFNFFKRQAGHVQLADFGLSKEGLPLGHETRTFCGTPEYLAPEVVLCRRHRTGYGHSVDWWSLGAVGFEMMCGVPPFFDRDFEAMCLRILRKPLRFPTRSHVPHVMQSFLKGLLHKDPARRLGVGPLKAELRAHPVFVGVDWGALLRKEVDPPYRPRVEGKVDGVGNFDQLFTSMNPRDTPTMGRLAYGGGMWEEEEGEEGRDFAGFSFVDPQAMWGEGRERQAAEVGWEGEQAVSGGETQEEKRELGALEMPCRWKEWGEGEGATAVGDMGSESMSS